IAEARGVQAIARTLSTVDEVWRQPVPVGQAAFAAALNVSLDNARCTTALVGGGALQPHLRALAADSPAAAAIAIWPLVSSSLDNLCESDAATQQFERHADYARTVLRALARMARTLSDAPAAAGEEATAAVRGAQRTLLWILCETLEKSATVRQQLCTPEAVLALFSVLEFYLLGSGAEEGEDEEEDDSDRGNRPLPPNRPLPQAANRRADAVTQAIVGISGEDAALETLFADASLQARLLGILTADRDSSGDAQRVDAMAAAAALCLGNLARTDAHCTQLVEQHPAIVRTLIHEWFAPSAVSSSSSANTGAGVSVRTRHAASGLLKNLCLAAANRPVLVRFGLVRAAARCIDTAVIPIQANAIGILRHLAGGSASSSAAEAVLGLLEEIPAARDGASKARALADLLRAVASTDVDGIRCEGTRLVAAVAKKVYLPAERQDNAAAPALAQAREMLEQQRLDIVSPLVRLVLLDGRRHPLLQQESLVALTVLAATDPHRSRHVADIVRLLAAGEERQKKEDGDANGDDDDDAPATFGRALESILTQNGAVWPQTTLQAKSLVSHLCAIVDSSTNNDGDDNASAFDASGLAVLQTTLAPLST
ncbi:Rap1 GTPase-GDP dissociation stimulator 1, partial [Coemansia sp. RSA 2049]